MGGTLAEPGPRRNAENSKLASCRQVPAEMQTDTTFSLWAGFLWLLGSQPPEGLRLTHWEERQDENIFVGQEPI